MHDVTPGREKILTVLDMLKHPADVTLAHVTLRMLR